LIYYITSVQKVLGLHAHLFKNESPVVPQLTYSPDLSPSGFPVPETGD
jgi:hypothetical protein